MPTTSAAMRLRICLLGLPRFALDNEPFEFSVRPKALPLLCYLLLHRDGPLSRAALAFSLWPDDEEEKARANLRRHLRYLAQALPAGTEPWVVISGLSVAWNPRAPLWLDVAEFERLIACGDPATAVELYRGDLLENCYDECLQDARERLRNAYLAALTDLVVTRRAARDFRSATEYARRLLLADPWREDIVRELMAVRYASGDAAGALAEFDRFERLLRAEMNVKPMPETVALRAAVIRNAATPQVEAASAPATANPAKTNLPAQRTSLIGREAEVQEIERLLQVSRLVTVTGAGGVGKTQTALAVGDAHLKYAAAGVWFVDLARLAPGSSVARAIARALSVQETPKEPLLETLQASINTQSLLLILDNCEHVIAEAAIAASAFLGGCPQLRMLATSREPLRIVGEHVYRIPSLSFPPPQDAGRLTAAAANQHAAIVLFAERARAACHTFALTDENVATVTDICRRLDGIPLAIELAAVRVGGWPLEIIAKRLDQRFTLLMGGDRAALPRHQTMRALIDWSYDLLSLEERHVLRSLSVFAGTWTLEAASAVFDAEASDSGRTAELVSSLVDKSLVAVERSGDTLRYRLLESIRAYASEKSRASDEAPALAESHARYYIGLAHDLWGRWNTGLSDAEEDRWRARVEPELDDALRVNMR